MIIWLMAKGKTNCAKVRRSGEERFCFQRFNSYLNRSSPPFDLTQTRVRDFGKQTHAGVVRDRANLLATIPRPLPHREKRIFFGGITAKASCFPARLKATVKKMFGGAARD